MNEEFIIRIGANARAMYSELQRAGAYGKAWATTLAEDFKGKLGRMFAAGFILEKGIEALDRVKDKILAIHRAQEELPGASSNFIQGLMNYTEKVGLSFEAISKPLLKFKQTLDAAKADPQGKQMADLQRYGIVTDANELKNQKLSTSLARLSDAYLKYGKNLQMVNDLAGKNNPAMLNLLNMGAAKISGMEDSSFFTKLSEKSIDQFSAFYSGAKGAGQAGVATFGNIAAWIMSHNMFTLTGRAIGQTAGDPLGAQGHPWQRIKDIWNGISDAQEKSNEALAASLEMEKQKVEANNQLNAALEHQTELRAAINDQGKSTVDQLAQEGRKLTGHRAPRLYAATPLMREAMQIKDLETQAEIDWQKTGVAPKDSPFWQQAQAMRASDPRLKDADQFPIRKTEEQLKAISDQIQPLSDAAKMVNAQHGSDPQSKPSVPARPQSHAATGTGGMSLTIAPQATAR